MLFITLIRVTLLLSCFALDCSPPISNPAFLAKSYFTHVAYIRKGVYSRVVQQYFNMALRDANKACTCKEGLLDASCLRTYFVEQTFEARKLKDLLQEELLLLAEKRRFPLYRMQILPKLTNTQRALISYDLSALTQTSSVTPAITSQHWIHGNFTSDEILFEDNLLDKGEACASLMDQVTEDKRTLSAPFLTGYAIGIFQKVRFNGGNIRPVLHFLSSYFQNVFNAASCYQKAGEALRIPVSLVLDFVPNAMQLIGAANRRGKEVIDKDLPKLHDMHATALRAIHGYKEIVEQVCSLMSFGASRQYLKTTGNSVQHLVTEKLSIDMPLLATTYSEYIAFYNFLDKRAVVHCPPQWTFIERFGVSHPYMQCCSPECLKVSASPLNLYIDREICCEGCNYLDCPGSNSYVRNDTFVSIDDDTAGDGALDSSIEGKDSSPEASNVVI